MSIHDPFDRFPFSNVVEMFWNAVDEAPERTALVEGDSSTSYHDYGAAVAALAAELGDLRVARKCVAVVMPNSTALNVAVFAGWAAGAQVALLNPGYGVAELAPLIDIAKPQVMIVAQSNETIAREVAALLNVSHLLVVGTGSLSVDALAVKGKPRPAVAIGNDQPATLMFTGGTTGIPKGVDRSHGKLMTVVKGMQRAWPTRIDDEIWLNVAPVFHVWGSMMGLLNPVYGRSTLVIVPQFHPDTVLAGITEHRVTVFSGGPAAIYVSLLATKASETADLSSLRLCPGGGSPFLMDTLLAWEARFKTPILEAFGMTEGGPISANPVNGGHRYGTVGRALEGVEVRIVSLDDPERELEIGEVGEIRIRGEQVVNRYRGQDEGHPDGWLYTGDVGLFDKEGYLTLVDRTKNMLIVSGFNVYPREIEEVLAQHEAVAEAAVIGITDERTGEAPVAFVRLHAGRTAEPEALRQYCTERLVRYRHPRWVRIVDAIPKTPANKTCRQSLLAMAAKASADVAEGNQYG